MRDRETADPSSAFRAQCWECRRRRLVCDGGKPACVKCLTAGIACPGYADKKPLVWVANGEVLSRPRGRKPKEKPEKMRSARPVTMHEVGRNGLVQAGSSANVVPGLPPLRRDMRLRTDQCDMVEAVDYCKFPEAGPRPRPPCLAYLGLRQTTRGCMTRPWRISSRPTAMSSSGPTTWPTCRRPWRT